MSNMSYCRFENTLMDLQDCANHITDSDLSDDERMYRKRLVELCKDIVKDWELYEDEEGEE